MADELNQEIKIKMPKLLLQALADTYNLYYQSQVSHWNIEGKDFYQYHKLFQEMYEDSADAIDTIAERIRALDSLIPESIQQLFSLVKSDNSNPSYITRLFQLHVALSEEWDVIAKAADTIADSGTVDMAGKRAAEHSKFAWMLRSIQKDSK